MLFLVSGEGPTDIGTWAHGKNGRMFQPGPMALFIDKLVEAHLRYSLLARCAMQYMSETELANLKPRKKGRKLGLPGKRRPKETRYYFNNALLLAQEAQRRAESEGCKMIPVLFRDADGTHSAKRGIWLDKLDSMLEGFRAAGCDVGVPMIPKPKSEAWLLCACKPQPYQHCAALEQESGNDKAPNSLKKQLVAALQGDNSAEHICEAVENGHIDVLAIDMPSYNCFRQRLGEVIDQ